MIVCRAEACEGSFFDADIGISFCDGECIIGGAIVEDEDFVEALDGGENFI